MYFSLVVIKCHLPDDAYDTWKEFVQFCNLICKPVIQNNLICKPVIQNTGITKANEHLMTFCRSFQNLYGSLAVTPNMHLHSHLIECTLDYGPTYSFWLFTLERYNGCLGSCPTNNKKTEVQMMCQFLRGQAVQRQTKQELQTKQNCDLLARLRECFSRYPNSNAVTQIRRCDPCLIKTRGSNKREYKILRLVHLIENIFF